MGRPNQRNDTFRKRKKGLKKKASEFSILCGVDTCLVSFSPNGDLETWPEDKSACMNVVQRYMSLPKEHREKKMLNSTGFVKDKIKKVQEKLDSLRRENSAILYPSWDDRLDHMSVEYLAALANRLNAMISFLRERLSMGNVGVVQKMEEQEVREIERGEMINPHLLNQLLTCNFPVMNVEPISMKPSENLGLHEGLYRPSENLELHEGLYRAGEMEQFQNVNFGVSPLMGFDPKNNVLTPPLNCVPSRSDFMGQYQVKNERERNIFMDFEKSGERNMLIKKLYDQEQYSHGHFLSHCNNYNYNNVHLPSTDRKNYMGLPSQSHQCFEQ
ncbi:hypothetical protein AMTRI_Chr01g113790 [Amborella trichopoda]|uniref:MADS-box domain-containing protein n=1 Tax=Amborella trichopoda TaxID=13333 RepID=W1PX82_AMBTC|nr:MADS-box transcription factor 25-like [Amborella trichopoda]ERN12554.1 hypothetical protein AMTR_s00025p00207310 [Amborella trichopoda]|eukprot:XP_020526799.1 MADS-box transcription factor 25-like [Amborella trichopoda]